MYTDITYTCFSINFYVYSILSETLPTLRGNPFTTSEDEDVDKTYLSMSDSEKFTTAKQIVIYQVMRILQSKTATGCNWLQIQLHVQFKPCPTSSKQLWIIREYVCVIQCFPAVLSVFHLLWYNCTVSRVSPASLNLVSLLMSVKQFPNQVCLK